MAHLIRKHQYIAFRYIFDIFCTNIFLNRHIHIISQKPGIQFRISEYEFTAAVMHSTVSYLSRCFLFLPLFLHLFLPAFCACFFCLLIRSSFPEYNYRKCRPFLFTGKMKSFPGKQTKYTGLNYELPDDYLPFFFWVFHHTRMYDGYS